MIKFELEIISENAEDTISGLSRGHMTITGSKTRTTSKGKRPDQSMMIFLSVLELLDGIRRLILDEKDSSYDFIGADSSFLFSVTKLEVDRIRLSGDQGTIDVVQTTELIQAVWKGVSTFLASYGDSIKSDDSVIQDMHSAIEGFKSAFKTHN